MNYYNPYFYTIPNMAANTSRVGLFSRLLGGNRITLSGILNGTGRVLNFANQAIPLVKQVRPMIGNAKTMFKVMNEFKKTEKKSNTNDTPKKTINKEETQIKENNEISNNTTMNDGGPTFFM